MAKPKVRKVRTSPLTLVRPPSFRKPSKLPESAYEKALLAFTGNDFTISTLSSSHLHSVFSKFKPVFIKWFLETLEKSGKPLPYEKISDSLKTIVDGLESDLAKQNFSTFYGLFVNEYLKLRTRLPRKKPIN